MWPNNPNHSPDSSLNISSYSHHIVYKSKKSTQGENIRAVPISHYWNICMGLSWTLRWGPIFKLSYLDKSIFFLLGKCITKDLCGTGDDTGQKGSVEWVFLNPALTVRRLQVGWENSRQNSMYKGNNRVRMSESTVHNERRLIWVWEANKGNLSS